MQHLLSHIYFTGSLPFYCVITISNIYYLILYNSFDTVNNTGYLIFYNCLDTITFISKYPCRTVYLTAMTNNQQKYPADETGKHQNKYLRKNNKSFRSSYANNHIISECFHSVDCLLIISPTQCFKCTQCHPTKFKSWGVS